MNGARTGAIRSLRNTRVEPGTPAAGSSVSDQVTSVCPRRDRYTSEDGAARAATSNVS